VPGRRSASGAAPKPPTRLGSCSRPPPARPRFLSPPSDPHRRRDRRPRRRRGQRARLDGTGRRPGRPPGRRRRRSGRGASADGAALAVRPGDPPPGELVDHGPLGGRFRGFTRWSMRSPASATAPSSSISGSPWPPSSWCFRRGSGAPSFPSVARAVPPDRGAGSGAGMGGAERVARPTPCTPSPVHPLRTLLSQRPCEGWVAALHRAPEERRAPVVVDTPPRPPGHTSWRGEPDPAPPG
jgi:hypothetical protein